MIIFDSVQLCAIVDDDSILYIYYIIVTVNYSIITLIQIFISYSLRLYLPHNAKIHFRISFYTPPDRTPNGGGYSFSKFFYFFFFDTVIVMLFQQSFHSRMVSFRFDAF